MRKVMKDIYGKRFRGLYIPALVVLSVVMLSCSPQSKESYLHDYKDFITEVKTSKLSPEEWKEADKKFQKYRGEWYNKFKQELTWKDEIILKKYEFEYNLIRAKESTEDILDELFDKDAKKLKKQLKFYSENGMQEDIKFLVKQAEEAGDAAEETLKEIFEELNLKMEDYQ